MSTVIWPTCVVLYDNNTAQLIDLNIRYFLKTYNFLKRLARFLDENISIHTSDFLQSTQNLFRSSFGEIPARGLGDEPKQENK